jgi:hypothetical protein
MTDSLALYTVSLLICLFLVGSALVSYRLSFGHLVRIALAWVVIFFTGFLIVSWLAG